jgi:uncharacterized protein
MERRRFGRTELAMPVFSCGGMRYQFRWQDLPLAQIPIESQQNLEATVRRALGLGINHIETARGYGSSERQLGEILPACERGSLIVQTKVSPTEDPAEFEHNFRDSLARLGLEYVDLLGLHGVNNRTVLGWALRPGGCFDVAQRLRAEGKVRFIGFSTHAALPVILEAIAFGDQRPDRGFDYMNLHWYYILQRNWPAIVEARKRDMGVFIISPTDKGGRLYAPPQKLERLCAPLSPIVFNDLFCLSHPDVHTLSIGASRPTDFDEHLRALPLLSRAAEVLSPIHQRLRGAMQDAIGTPDPEAFLVGLPEFEQLPQNVNLATILWLLNLAEGWDLVDFGRWRFGLLDNAGHWFAGNRPRSPADIDDALLLAALGDYPGRAEVPALLRRALGLLGGQENRRLSEGG